MNSCGIRNCKYWNGTICTDTDTDTLYDAVCRYNSYWSTEEGINKMQKYDLRYIYVILCGDTISGLGFDSFEKAEQWLITERNCERMGNDWVYKDKDLCVCTNKCNCFCYYIKEVKII